MSQFHGMLLFDIADPPIGNWEENLGYRGMLDEWNLKNTNIFLRIEPDEDLGEEEVWIGEDKGGNWESLFYGEYDDAIKFAKEFMNKNRDAKGWKDLIT